MFPRMNITTPLPSFAYCPPQYSAGVGFGGISPVVPYVSNPYVSSPSPVPYPVIGPNPYAVQPMIPCPPGPISAGISPFGPNPYAVQPMIPYPPGPISAGINPWCSPLSWNPYTFAPPAPAYPGIHPALAGLTSSAYSNAVTCIDPVTGAICPQPYPAAQSLLPIRPLVAAQTDPVQIAAMCAMMAPQMVDPYSVMTHLPAPMPVSPVSPMMRSPLYMSPVGSPMVGVPCAVTPGIPC
jgi:hypothetical protein